MKDMAEANRNGRYGPLPIIIGVTGHRDLRAEDRQKLTVAVDRVFQQIRAKCPHTPLILLSPLAEGADRLVAHVALNLNLRLIVPLPMRRELYERDFTSAESLAEFRQLLARAEHSFELPVVEGRTEAEIGEPGPARDCRYEQVGAYIVRHSQILIALWDGEQSGLIGGTSEIIRFQLEGLPKAYAPRSPLDIVDSGPVYHIVTPHSENAHPKAEPFSLNVIFPIGHSASAEAYDRTYARTDTFNRDVLEQESVQVQRLIQSREDLFPEELARDLPTALKELRDLHALADMLAFYYKGQTKAALILLLVFVFVAAIIFGLYAHIFPERDWLLLLYLFITAVPWLVYHWARKKGCQDKYQDYRSLAEGMRVQFFWRLANVQLSAANYYMPKHRGELDWLRNALRVLNVTGNVVDPIYTQKQDRAQLIRLMLEYWVTDQLKYFVKTGGDEHEELTGWYEPWIKFLLQVGVGLAVLLVFVLLMPHPWGSLIHEIKPLHGALLVLLTTPLAVAALLHSYIEQRAYSEHIRQYSRMGQIFARAEHHLNELTRQEDYQAAQRLIEELGKEALAENGDWLLLHRARPMEVPPPGG